MKKSRIIVLIFLLLYPFALSNFAQAADVKTSSVSIPVQTGLTGTNNSSKTFTLDLPSGVDSSSIKTGSLKYSGNNVVSGSISVVNGKINITLKGNERSEKFEVNGYEDHWDQKYVSTIGNSIWRYADGQRWQFTNYIPETRSQYSFDATGDGPGISLSPPQKPLKTFSEPVNPNLATWFTNDRKKIPFSTIDQSSIKINHGEFRGGAGLLSSPLGGRYIVSYTAPTGFYLKEETSDKFEKGDLVLGRLYYLELPYYFTAQVQQATYSYAGNVSFEYALPEGPSLTGLVIVNKPNPNPFKYANANVPVNLTLKGILSGYENTANISEWVFYAQEKGYSNTLDTKKNFEKNLSSSQVFDKFSIPMTKIANSTGNYQQVYELRVTVRFKKPIETKTGPIDQISEKLEATVEVYKGEPSIIIPPVPDPPPTPKGKPPVAFIFANPLVKAGEELVANASASYDPDGKIIGYHFLSEYAKLVSYSEKGDLATIWFPSERVGQNSIGLTVVDNDMMFDSAGTFVQVIEPIPEASLEIGGTKKQNRKVTLINTSKSPKHYPIDSTKTKITISAVSGAGGSNAAIKYSGSLSGISQKDVLFKQPGLYKATIYVENTLGYSSMSEVTFEIVPDDPPNMYFSMPGRVYRDPQNGNKAVVSLDDLSYSPDNDIISRRVWEYRFDSDNDKSFEDETWVVFNDGNKHRLNLELSHVGRYEIRHTAYETFNQPTIDEFVTAADRRFADSSEQHIDEKIVEVMNLGPEGDWVW